MAVGDDAVAAGYSLTLGTVPANTIKTEINRLADWVAQRTSAVLAIAKGGTGATTAAQARSNLGLGSAAEQNAANYVTNISYGSNGIGLQWVSPRVRLIVDGTFQGDIAQAGELANYVGKTGDHSMGGQLLLPNSYAASSGWTSAYINSDGRVSKGASALRFKKYVTAQDPMTLGDIWPVWHRYQMKSDGTLPAEGKWRYGPIADYMAEHADQEGFVVYDSEGQVESVDFIGLLLAQVAQLNVRLKTLEGPTND